MVNPQSDSGLVSSGLVPSPVLFHLLRSCPSSPVLFHLRSCSISGLSVLRLVILSPSPVLSYSPPSSGLSYSLHLQSCHTLLRPPVCHIYPIGHVKSPPVCTSPYWILSSPPVLMYFHPRSCHHHTHTHPITQLSSTALSELCVGSACHCN
jgi:hypothetical protein